MKLSKKNAARQRTLQKAIASGKTLGGLLVGLTAATVVGGCKEPSPAPTMGIYPRPQQQANATSENAGEFVTQGVIAAPGNIAVPKPKTPQPKPNAVREQRGKPATMGKMPVRGRMPPPPPLPPGQYRVKNRDLEYYPLGSLNFHVSGMDVTFEKDKQYRAAFLIREYKVYDLVNKRWKEEQRPTYIYEDMLMGISVFGGINIQWVTEHTTTGGYKTESRVNVAAYKKDEHGRYIKDKNRNYIKEEIKDISKEEFKLLPEEEKKKYFFYSGKMFKRCTRPWNYRKIE